MRKRMGLSMPKRTRKIQMDPLPKRGLGRAHSFRANRPNWTFVAYTKNSLFAGSQPEFKSTFDGLLEKSELAKRSTHESAVELVRSEIEGARRRRRAPWTETIPRNVRIV